MCNCGGSGPIVYSTPSPNGLNSSVAAEPTDTTSHLIQRMMGGGSEGRLSAAPELADPSHSGDSRTWGNTPPWKVKNIDNP